MSSLTAGLRSTRSAALLIIVALAALALVLAYTTLTWLHIPAPAPVSLGFADLKLSTETPDVPTTAVQHAYFAWLAWTLLVVVGVLTAGAVIIGTRTAGVISAVASLVALVLQVFAAKGPLTWSAFFDSVDQFRIGAYFALLAWIVFLAIGSYIALTSPVRTIDDRDGSVLNH